MTAQFLAVTTFTQLTNHSSTAPISLSQTHKRSAQPIDLPPTQESSVAPTNLSASYDWLIGDTHLPFAYHSLLQKLAFLTSLVRKKASQIWLVKKKWLIFQMTHQEYPPTYHSSLITWKTSISNLIGQKKGISNLIGQKKSDSSSVWLIVQVTHLISDSYMCLVPLTFQNWQVKYQVIG
jgi:hypothetical protein